jgi:hypothetical protein
VCGKVGGVVSRRQLEGSRQELSVDCPAGRQKGRRDCRVSGWVATARVAVFVVVGVRRSAWPKRTGTGADDEDLFMWQNLSK